jgi:glyoxylase-like metal-dependent hydrolase (beta-lactamase superfamily II)
VDLSANSIEQGWNAIYEHSVYESMALIASREIEYPFPEYPDAGVSIEVMPGVHWISTPLPFRLRAINLYLLEESDGWTIVDCGISREDVRAQWEQIFSSTLKGKPVTRLIVTHFHPDHAGNAAWLAKRWNVRPWMTQAEWLTANLALRSSSTDNKEQRCQFYIANGLDEAHQERFRSGMFSYSQGVQLPSSFNRLCNGDVIIIGGRRWKVIVGQGHSPEHVSLYCDEIGILIAGDQLLPEITPNISVWPDEPEADLLQLYLQSLDRFNELLRHDTLVLPAHKRPFYGVHTRIAELKFHHRERLDTILGIAARGPVTAGELLPNLFQPNLDGFQIGFAMGEALAHLNYLVNTGELRRYEDEGIIRFAPTNNPHAVDISEGE